MLKTALQLTPQQWQAYCPGRHLDETQIAERWGQARKLASRAAALLRERFGATRVVAFGSVTRSAWFTPWSDVDLAVWGLPPSRFYRAVAALAGLSAEFEVDLVDGEECRPALREAIAKEGIDL